MKEPLHGFEWNQMDAPAEVEGGLFTVVAKAASGSFHAVGTGFVVRALDDVALGVSAGQVFAEVQKLQQQQRGRSHATTLPEFAPALRPIKVSFDNLAMVSNVASVVVISQVEGLAFDELGDIGVVQLRTQSACLETIHLQEFNLDDETPEIGRLVCVASYINLSCMHTGPDQFQIQRQAVLRVGRVLQVFPSGQRLCRGPCFETSIPMFSGMSGGPVFYYDIEGAMRVMGLVCSDLDANGPDKNDRSISGRSLIASLPVRRLSGSSKGRQEISMSFVPTSVAGQFSSFEDIRVTAGTHSGFERDAPR